MKPLLFPTLLIISSTACLAQAAQPIQESPGAAKSLGYTSVQQALASLKAKAGVTVAVTKPDGWVIANEPAPEFATWSFAPENHYAYPAVVRRQIKQDANGAVTVQMTALCQAEKEPCDRLIREFEKLNESMREQVRLRLKQREEEQ